MHYENGCFTTPLYQSVEAKINGRVLTEALALIGRSVHVDLGADDVAEGHEHLSKLRITKLLRKMVDEEVAALRPCLSWRKIC